MRLKSNHCQSELHAIDHANLRGGDKYSTSGVGTCQCRHMMVRPNGVGNLQKGERWVLESYIARDFYFTPDETIRYCNMDYIFWSSLKGCTHTTVLISYGIACQWHKCLMARREALPMPLRESTREIATSRKRLFIPKFHIYAHGNDCQANYSLNFSRAVGRTDGGNIERGWAWMNPVSLSTREMAPGVRRDTLDDQWCFWNWSILTKLG